MSERVKRLDEIVPMVRFLFRAVQVDEAAREKVLAKEGAGRGAVGRGRGARGASRPGRPP